MKLLETRWSIDKVSFNFQTVITVKNIPIIPKTTNTPIHEVKEMTALPASGESSGETLKIIVRSAKNLVNSSPLYTSRTIAREITSPAEAAKPSMKRKVINISILGAKAQPIEEIKKRIIEINKGLRLP